MRVKLSWSLVPGRGMGTKYESYTFMIVCVGRGMDTSMKIFDGMEDIKGHHKADYTKLQI